jgi:hypothetical protein
MSINTTQIMYNQIAPVNGLNSVPGFDPRRYLRKTVTETGQELLVLDLKYRKLWFRLKYPAGRIVTTPVTVTEENAVFETEIFFDSASPLPNATNTATRAAKGKYTALYIQNAQNASIGEALSDAGFGLQFCDVAASIDVESTGGEVIQAVQPQAAAPIPAPVPEVMEPASAPAIAEESAAVESKENEEPKAAEPVAEPVAEQKEAPEVVEEIPAADIAADESETPAAPEAPAPRFTPDMPVEDILHDMTPEEAEAVLVDFGLCDGMTLAEVAENRPASLKFFMTGYAGENNLVKAGAQIVYGRRMADAA